MRWRGRVEALLPQKGAMETQALWSQQSGQDKGRG